MVVCHLIYPNGKLVFVVVCCRIFIFYIAMSKIGYFFIDPKDYEEGAFRKAKVDGEAFNYLRELKKLFQESDWTTGGIEKTLRDYIARKEIKLKTVVQPLRLVITGTLATPGIFDTLHYVGQEPVVRRLENFLANFRPPG